jgi:TetR/AcrR family transcriptional repressor of nem operon
MALPVWRLRGETIDMARLRAFDEQKALEAAVACFWARGYEATSVRDLGTSMGIAGASLYNAYGGKKSLFIRALDHYCNTVTRDRLKRVESAHAGRGAIVAFFNDVIARAVDDKERKGCLLINSAIELAPHDSELREIIVRYLDEITAFFHRNVKLAQARGEVPSSIDLEQFSVHLMGVLMGIRVLCKVNPDRKLLTAVACSALDLLQNPSSN